MNQSLTTYEQAQQLLAIVKKLGLNDAIIGIAQYHIGQVGPAFRPANVGEPGPLVVAIGDNGADVGQALAIALGKHISVRGFGVEHCLHRVYNMLTVGTDREINEPSDFRLYLLSLIEPAQAAYQSALKGIVEAK
jgi:hypothetical protein